MNYNIEDIQNGIAKVRYADGSWAELVLTADMTKEDLDDLAFQFAPKVGTVPSFLTVGMVSTASAKPVLLPTDVPIEGEVVDPDDAV